MSFTILMRELKAKGTGKGVKLRKGLGAIIILLAAGLVGAAYAYQHFRVEFWLLTPVDKFNKSWTDDLTSLRATAKLPNELDNVANIQIRADNSPAQNWLPYLKPPIKKKSDGKYKLNVFITHWIEGNRFGVIVQHNLIHLPSGNNVWELNRNYKLGIYY